MQDDKLTDPLYMQDCTSKEVAELEAVQLCNRDQVNGAFHMHVRPAIIASAPRKHLQQSTYAHQQV